jgi:peroxiredoxin
MRKNLFIAAILLAALQGSAQTNEYEQELAAGQNGSNPSGQSSSNASAVGKTPAPFSAIGKTPAPFSAVGAWRGVFLLRPGVEVPFNFEIRTSSDGSPKIFFRNGTEWFDGGHIRQTTDSFFIPIDQFDNEFAFAIGEGTLNGTFRKQDHSGNPLVVRIEPNDTRRFDETGPTPAGNFSGTYAITFTGPNGKTEPVVGLFKQEGKKLSGTFLRITGDSRYLEGIVEGNNFYLSSFYGSGPAYYKGSFTADGHLSGESVGVRGSQPFTGIADPKAALPDPYKLTWLKAGYTSFDFSFPDIDGHPVSLKDQKFAHKVVIVTIGGTWCPNCVDETSFLAPWYKANHIRGIEVVSLQYERSTDSAFLRKVLTRQRERYDIKYDQLIGGIADKQAVANSLPALNTFLAFPTTIFIDKQGRVARIHTGYTGPATGPYYQEFLKEFNEEIDTLVKQ